MYGVNVPELHPILINVILYINVIIINCKLLLCWYARIAIDLINIILCIVAIIVVNYYGVDTPQSQSILINKIIYKLLLSLLLITMALIPSVFN